MSDDFSAVARNALDITDNLEAEVQVESEFSFNDCHLYRCLAPSVWPCPRATIARLPSGGLTHANRWFDSMEACLKNMKLPLDSSTGTLSFLQSYLLPNGIKFTLSPEFAKWFGPTMKDGDLYVCCFSSGEDLYREMIIRSDYRIDLKDLDVGAITKLKEEYRRQGM